MSIEELLSTCTVKILVPGDWGTGFLVGDGWILTCAHVVESIEEGSSVRFIWNEQPDEEHEATLRRKIDPAQADVALLEFQPSTSNIPCAYLDLEQDVRATDQAYTFGYPKSFQQGFEATASFEGSGPSKDIEPGGVSIASRVTPTRPISPERTRRSKRIIANDTNRGKSRPNSPAQFS